jgi:dUTP pyrophosphatase
MKIEFVKVHEDAQLPKKNFDDPLTGDTGFDIFSIEEVIIPAGESAIVGVGLEIGYITPGYWFKIEGRSGLAFKKEVDPHFGIIDNSYRGEFDIKLFNSSREDVKLPKGYAVAQMIVFRLIDCQVGWAETHQPGQRGKEGFGSSDVKHIKVIEPEEIKFEEIGLQSDKEFALETYDSPKEKKQGKTKSE